MWSNASVKSESASGFAPFSKSSDAVVVGGDKPWGPATGRVHVEQSSQLTGDSIVVIGRISTSQSTTYQGSAAQTEARFDFRVEFDVDLPTPFVIAGNIETGTTGGAIGAGESSIQIKLTGVARTLDNSLASAWDLFDDRATLESQLTALVRENVQRLMGVKLAEEAPTTSGAEA